MQCKTILVHIAEDADHMARLEVAIDLAQHFGAHVIGLLVEHPLEIPAEITGRGASLSYVRQTRESAHARAEKIDAAVHERAAAAGVDMEWRFCEEDHHTAVARHSIYADLTIVSQFSKSDAAHRLALPFPDDVPFIAAGPVLILPAGWQGGEFGARILIGWKESAEAGRTVRWALPFLRRAEAVALLTIEEEEPRERPPLDCQTTICEALARHGVRARHVKYSAQHGGIGAQLLAAVDRENGDMLVMGAYGHARWREVLVGGATRHILTHAEIPVLMGH